MESLGIKANERYGFISSPKEDELKTVYPEICLVNAQLEATGPLEQDNIYEATVRFRVVGSCKTQDREERTIQIEEIDDVVEKGESQKAPRDQEQVLGVEGMPPPKPSAPVSHNDLRNR